MKNHLILAWSCLLVAGAAVPVATAAMRPQRARTLAPVAKRVRADRPSYIPAAPPVAIPSGGAPPIPAASPQWVTDDKFALSALQWETKHGRAQAESPASVGADGLFFSSGSGGKYQLEVEPAFVGGRDVTVRCWGKFPGVMMMGAAGEQPDGDWYPAGTTQLPKPPGGTGWVQATVPGGSIAGSDTLVVALWSTVVGSWRLDQCIVERDA